MKMKLLFTTLCVVLLSLSCSQKVAEEHAHEEGPEALAYTVYSDKTELFVEFKPLVLGQTSKFAAHFTVLGDTFKALTEGKVTLSLIVGERGIRQTATEPSSPGIFRLALEPVVSGKGKLVFDIETNRYTDQIVIDPVTVFGDAEAAGQVHEHAAEGDVVSFLKEQAWKVDFANAAVKKQPFSQVIPCNGQVLSAPGDETVVTAKSSGIVSFATSKISIGAEVGSGTSLFRIAGNEMVESNSDAAFQEAQANLAKAKVDLQRAQELVKDKLISEREFQDTKLKLENAQIAFNTLSKNFGSGGYSVQASMGGFVKNILVSEGQFVQAGTPLLTISKNKKLQLRVDLSQKYFDQLSGITSANFKFPFSEQVYNTAELNGKVLSFGKSASSDSPFIPVIFEIDNLGNIVPGSVAEVFVKSFPIPDALLIPVSSLMEEQGNHYVYVQTAGERFQKREVKLSGSDGRMVQVLSGLKEGERVVTKGAYQIKLASASGAMPAHGHEH